MSRRRMKGLLKHKLLVGAVALVVAASAGGAYAGTQSGTTSRQAFLNDVAKRLNVTPSQLRSAVQGALLDRLEAAVKAGRITQAQSDRIKQRIEEGGALPLGPLGDGVFRHHMFGPGGPGIPGGPGSRPHGLARHSLLPAAASYLAVSSSQLLSDLRAGKSLAQVAQDEGKSVSGLEQALTTAARARLDALVSAGALTKAQEQRRLSRLSARLDRLVNAQPLVIKGPAGGPRGPAGGPPPSPSNGAPSLPPPAPSDGAPSFPPPPAA